MDWSLERYKGAASIEMIELANSPVPGTVTWNGTNAQLVELMNKTYDRVKSKYPDVAVGTPGFEYWIDADTGADKAFIDVLEYVLDKNNGAKFVFWANGWQDRRIIDTEHDNITEPGAAITGATEALDAAYVVQELVLKRTLMSGSTPVLTGALPLKSAPRGTVGEAALSSLSAEGSVTMHVKARRSCRRNGKTTSMQDMCREPSIMTGRVWIERLSSPTGELYLCFKPFTFVSGRKIALAGQRLDYALTLPSTPSSAVVTDVSGSTATLKPSRNVVLTAENSPGFLEAMYP